MKKGIVVLKTDQKQCQDLCLYLVISEKNRYTAHPVYSIENLAEYLNESET